MQLTLQSRVTKSATLAINEEVAALRAAGEDIIHLGFGEAGLPPHPLLMDALAKGAPRNFYPSTAGSASTREAIARFFTTQRDLPTKPEQIVTAPGSKALLFALMDATQGAVVLTRPSWVSYGAQAALLGRDIIWVDAPKNEGGFPDPAALERELAAAVAHGSSPAVLVTTLPDNPTGSLPARETVEAVAEIVRTYNLLHISDEIYRELVHDSSSQVVSPAEILPENVVVTGGLSKSLALGGWRTGYMRVPDSPQGAQIANSVVAIGSEIWSAMPAPVEPAVEVGVSENPEIIERIAASVRVHGSVARAVYGIFTELGITCRAPQGGFYLYPDFGPHSAILRAKGIETSEDLAHYLLREHSVATLPGTAFGDLPERLCLRIATSMLYGVTPEEKLAALESPTASTPVIEANLRRIRSAFEALLDPESTPTK